MSGLGARSRFRHYVNLHRMESRLKRLLQDFRWDRMDRVFAAELAAPGDHARVTGEDNVRTA